MALSDKRFAPRDFLSVIDDVAAAVPLALSGLAKADPANPDVLLFAPDGTCRRWIPIPVDLIDSVTPLRRYECGDHHHPVVRLVFAEPATPEAAAFAALAGFFEGWRRMAQTMEAKAGLASPGAAAARLQMEAPDGGAPDGGTVDRCKKCEDDCRALYPGLFQGLLRFACRQEKCPSC